MCLGFGLRDFRRSFISSSRFWTHWPVMRANLRKPINRLLPQHTSTSQILLKLCMEGLHQILSGKLVFQPYRSTVNSDLQKDVHRLFHVSISRLTDFTKIWYRRFTPKIDSDSDFYSYWAVIEQNIHKAINEIFCICHKRFHRFHEFQWHSHGKMSRFTLLYILQLQILYPKIIIDPKYLTL
jgi:hypothetical protein